MHDTPLIRQLELHAAPHELCAAVRHRPYPFLLDSAVSDRDTGRYSIVGCDPFLTVASRGRQVEMTLGGRRTRCESDPFDLLQTLLRQYAVRGEHPSLPFQGGAVGYLGYDMGRLVERLPGGPPDDLRLPDSFFAYYDAALVVDHLMDTAYLVSTGQPEPPGPRRVERAQRRLDQLEGWLHEREDRRPWCRPKTNVQTSSTFSRQAYHAAVRRAKDYIVAGDIYQVNVSQRFSAPAPGDPWLLYESLRRHNPAPFSAYLNMGAFAVLSSSPERFLRLRDGVIETSPIKGTRPRGVTEALDDGLALDLKNSVKDRAEHVMIVDLERNDLGRVAETGSVQVTEMMALRRFATVQHLVSTVRARLRPDTGVADLLRATFPGGSITGAPKIRAMEIIDELEPVRRGVYTGAIGYFSAHGGFDLNIAIRTMVVKDSVAHVHVGGGIVYDSDPEAEYQETLDKGRGMLAALGVTV